MYVYHTYICPQALRMSSKARQNRTVGEIVNLMSVDAQRLMDLVTYLYAVYSAPIQITLALVLLYKFLGPSVFAGLAVMILLIPINFVIAAKGRGYQVKGGMVLPIRDNILTYPNVSFI